MVSIHFPENTTYFICYSDNKKASWGKIEPTQKMDSGLQYLYQTTDEALWLEELKKHYVVEGYRFKTEEQGLRFKTAILNHYKDSTPELLSAPIEGTENSFWYILGDYPLTKIKSNKFQLIGDSNS